MIRLNLVLLNSEGVNISQTAVGTSGEPKVIIPSIKEKKQEVSKTEDITVANNDLMDKIEKINS